MGSVPPLIGNFRYRPEIDGLRAVAVLAVVLFHGGLGFQGGYVGVDVFFVISGYLITSLILNDLQQGRFTLAAFWERRARRIIPALAATVLATLIGGWFLMLPRDFAALGKSAACQSAFAANIYFWKTTLSGYFAGATDEMPLLHTWSLAVEEQFYLIYPLILTLLFRFHGLPTRRALFSFFSAAIIVSIFVSLYGVAHFRVAAFYLLPTRAWELLLGAGLAILPDSGLPINPLVREIASYLGLAGVVLPCFLYNGNTPFPGLAAMPPCVGACLIVWGTHRVAHDARPSSLGNLLAWRPMVFIGLISYSLYLWHWPLFAFSKYHFAGEQLAVGYRVGMVSLGLVLACLSWHFIETPFRRKTFCGSKKSIFRFAVSTLAITFIFGVGIVAFHGLPQRLPDALRASLAANPEDDYLFANEMELCDIAEGKLTPVGARDPELPVQVLVWGDSHAMAALPAFDAVLKENGLAGRAATHSATTPVLNYYRQGEGLRSYAPRFNEECVKYVEKTHVPHVVLIASWLGSQSNTTGSLEVAILTTVRRLVSAASQPWVFLDVPRHPLDISQFLRKRSTTLPDLNQDRYCAKPGQRGKYSGFNPIFLEQLRQAGARIIDPCPGFLNENRDLYQIERDGVILYRDAGHLTKRGAEKVLIPVLRQSFIPYLVTPLRTQ